jgi:RNA-directed DNA polymerase
VLETRCRFHALYDKIYRGDILGHAYDLVRSKKGSAGVDGVTFEAIEENEGVAVFIGNRFRPGTTLTSTS